MEKQINEKIREIEQSVNEMIPVAWDNLYIGINLASDGGGVYYFFNEEGMVTGSLCCLIYFFRTRSNQ
jgi:hypothetical protein